MARYFFWRKHPLDAEFESFSEQINCSVRADDVRDELWYIYELDGRVKQHWVKKDVAVDESQGDILPDIMSLCEARLVSLRMMDFLIDNGVKDVQFLPVNVTGSTGTFPETTYYWMNIIGLCNCIDLSRAKFFDFPSGRKMIGKPTLLRSRIDEGKKILLVRGYMHHPLLREDLAESIASSEMIGRNFEEAKVI